MSISKLFTTALISTSLVAGSLATSAQARDWRNNDNGYNQNQSNYRAWNGGWNRDAGRRDWNNGPRDWNNGPRHRYGYGYRSAPPAPARRFPVRCGTRQRVRGDHPRCPGVHHRVECGV